MPRKDQVFIKKDQNLRPENNVMPEMYFKEVLQEMKSSEEPY